MTGREEEREKEGTNHKDGEKVFRVVEGLLKGIRLGHVDHQKVREVVSTRVVISLSCDHLLSIVSPFPLFLSLSPPRVRTGQTEKGDVR